MAYIGIQPAESFTSFATQTFSVSATTSYTLHHAVANENEIALFVNNVRQQPGSGKAYTATGTALTLSAATATTDTMYCIFLGRALQTVTPATNSITAAMVGNDLISGKDALAAIPATTDELLISDAGTLKRIDAQFFQSTPSFHAFLSANQESLSDATAVKMQCNTETYDSDGTYDNSTNYRFTPGVAGKYYIYGGALVTADANSNMVEAEIYIYKNGSSIGKQTFNYTSNYAKLAAPTISIVDVADDNDYYELYSGVNTNNSGDWKAIGDSTQQRTYFGAYKIIGA